MNIDDVIKEFDEGLDPKSPKEKSLLEWNDLTNEPYSYPESEYELDPELVRQFLKDKLTEQRKELIFDEKIVKEIEMKLV